MGTPDFAVPTLNAIVQAGHDVVLVVSRPDAPSGRGRKMRSPPVIERARELGLPTSQPRAIKSGSFPARYASLNADVAVVLAYGRILTDHLLNSPKLGCINIHGSLLPRWRGAAPIQAVLLAGDAETGVCTQQMEADLDTGPLYVDKRLTVEATETAGSLHDKLMLLAAECAVDTLAMLPATPTPQQGEATYCGKIDKSMGLVDWGRSAIEIDRQIRAMSPWPGGFVPWNSKGALKILEARPADGSGPAGTMLSVKKQLIVATGDGAIELLSVRAPGKRSVSGADFANGAQLTVGDPFAPR